MADGYGGPGGIPEDPDSDCLMAYAGPELDAVFALEVTPQMFLYGSHNGMIKGFYLQEGELACELAGHRGTIRGLQCVYGSGSDGDATLYSCSVDGSVKAWSLTHEPPRGTHEVGQLSVDEKMSWTGHQGAVDCIHHDGKRLASGGRDGTIRLWEERACDDCQLCVKVHTGNVAAMRIHADSGKLQCFTCSDDGLGKLVDVEQKKLVAVYEGRGALHCLHYDAEDSLLYLAGSSKSVLIFDTRAQACIGQLRGHTEAVLGMEMYRHSDTGGGGPDAKQHLADGAKVLYTSSDDCTVRQWNLRHPDDWRAELDKDPKTLRPSRSPIHEGREDYVFGGHSLGVSCIRLTDTGVLYTASWDQSVRVWDREGAFDNIEARLQREREAAAARRAAAGRADKGKKKKKTTGKKKSGGKKSGGKKKKK